MLLKAFRCFNLSPEIWILELSQLVQILAKTKQSLVVDFTVQRWKTFPFDYQFKCTNVKILIFGRKVYNTRALEKRGKSREKNQVQLVSTRYTFIDIQGTITVNPHQSGSHLKTARKRLPWLYLPWRIEHKYRHTTFISQRAKETFI